MTEQVLDLRRSLQALRRRWRLLILLVVAGMAAGLLFSMVRGPKFVAGAAVLLPPARLDAEGNLLRDINTESHVAGSAEILDRAGKALTPPVGAEELRRRINVQPLSADIIEVRAEARSPGDAEFLAQSVAREYVAYANAEASEQADTSIEVLEQRGTELEEEIGRLQEQIASARAQLAAEEPGSTGALRQRAIVDSLLARESDAGRQLALLETQIAESQLEFELSRRGTRLLGTTTNAERTPLSRPPRNVGLGAVAGIFTGTVVALMLEHRDRRIRTRDEIADAIGAPVVASLPVPSGGSVGDHAVILARWAPSVVENVALRHAFSDLGLTGGSAPANVVVVTLPGDGAALRLASQLAAFAATLQTPTAFVVATQHATATPLAAACRERIPRPHLCVHGVAGDITAEELRWADLTVTVVVVEGEDIALPTWGRPTVAAIAVSSGFATADALASTALSYLDTGHPIRGVLVANPEPSDRTTGKLRRALPPPDSAVQRPDPNSPDSPEGGSSPWSGDTAVIAHQRADATDHRRSRPA
ncbi:MAG TPA: hypothetical protein VGR26_01350 [Acidimicrobiales bacterium]|nr:hypothetical protein [Acidimicrobiales bacterium]